MDTGASTSGTGTVTAVSTNTDIPRVRQPVASVSTKKNK